MLNERQKDELVRCWKDAEEVQRRHLLLPGMVYEALIRHPYWHHFQRTWELGEYDPDDPTFRVLGPLAKCNQILRERRNQE